MKKVMLEAPWETWCKELKAMFEHDNDIAVSKICELENDMDCDYAVTVTVRNHEKLLALDRLMPRTKSFGNVTLGIYLYDEENNEVDVASLFRVLFKGNPIVDSIQTRTDQTGTDWNYVLFKPDVIQFFDDDISDCNGLWSGLAEDIARDVFAGNGRGVCFCTALKESDDLNG